MFPANPTPEPPAASSSPPRPRRLLLASALLLAVAGLMGVLALFIASAGSIAFSPTPVVYALAGPAALAALIDVELVWSRHRWALLVTLLVTLYGLILGVATLASPFGLPLMIGSGLAALVVFSAIDAFPPRPDGPVGLSGRLRLAGAAVIAIIVLMQLTADPLKPGDVRTPDWAGVVASDAARTLVDGGTYGAFTNTLTTGVQDGALLLAGGTRAAPTWVVAYTPSTSEPSCYMTREFGYDDRDAVVILVPQGQGAIGLRVAKAADFDPGGVTDGRYTGALDPAAGQVASVAAAGSAPDMTPGTTAPAGYFCLDATGHVTRWDPGY